MKFLLSDFVRKKWNSFAKSRWYFPVTVLVIIIAVISLITNYWQITERYQRVEVYLLKLEADIHKLNALEWEAIATNEIDEENSQKYTHLHSEIATNLLEIQSLIPNWKGLQEVEVAYDKYISALELEFQFVAKGQTNQAFKVNAEQVKPIYHQLSAIIDQHSYNYAEQANNSIKKAQLEAAIAVIVAVVLILFLFATHECPLLKILNGAEHYLCDVEKERLDGTRVPCIVTATPFRGLNGELLGMVENFKNITERKQDEIELREQKEFSENLIRSSAVPTFVLDANHNILFWNTACEELTGNKAVDVIGTNNHWQAFYDHLRPCLADIIIDGNYQELSNLFSLHSTSLILSEGLHGEGWYDNLAGKRKYLVIDTAPVYNSRGELIAAIETIQDITQRKLAEEALHKSKEELSESEQTLRAMFRYAAVGIIHADLSGRLLNVNKKFCEILGYSKEDILNMKFKDLTDPEDMKKDVNNLRSLLAGDISMCSLEQRNFHKDGSIVWVNLTVSLVRDAMNSPKYFVGIIEDISERRRVTEILRENNLRINKELKLAHSIQASLFPINLPRISGATLAATTMPANEVGGDYCDLFITRKRKLGIAIGDVMGKGIPAALFVAMTYAYVRNFAGETESPSSILNKVNDVLYTPLESNQQFLTLFYAIYDPTSKVLSYANAGHNPPILYCAATGETQTLTVRSFYIGGREQTNYKEGSINLNPGDILLFYTDGLKEGKNPEGEQFGMDRIINLIKANYMQDPASIQDIIINEFNDFLLGEPPYDDVTMVIIKIS